VTVHAAAAREAAIRAGRALARGSPLDKRMFALLALALAIGWLVAVTILHVAKAGVHVLLVLALASACLHFFRARRASQYH